MVHECISVGMDWGLRDETERVLPVPCDVLGERRRCFSAVRSPVGPPIETAELAPDARLDEGRWRFCAHTD
ncbi:hypothetical protein CEXT_603511 [Caerostris extrusa]|uniref:Uncharacterized protein n=1 Tax=Caerostris extrusa TaxID=172846 RepID=A0AAV4PSZ1_CAEEX|nr:hypothetical protein CEXT_603511 [Caerostris extrusa]